MNSFQILLFDNGVKSHIVPTEFVQHLTDEMWDRFCSNVVNAFERVVGSEISFDLGGSISVLTRRVSVNIDGIQFSTSLRDVPALFNQLKDLNPRSFGDKMYYKLHTCWHAVVLSASQRNQLLEAWKPSL